MKTKVLIVENSRDITGAFKAIYQNVEDLSSEVDFYFCIPAQSQLHEHIDTDRFPVFKLPFQEISRSVKGNVNYPFRLWKTGRQLAKIVKEHAIDIIHSNDLYNLSPIVARFFTRFRLATHVRRMPESFPRPFYLLWTRLHLKHASVILPVSQANAEIFGSSRKVEVLYDRVCPVVNHPPYAFRPEPDPFKILCLANYTPGKGQNHALAAFREVVEYYGKGKRLQLNFYGGDFGVEKNRAFKKELEVQAEAWGIQASCSFNDFQSDIEYLFKQHDLALNFSDSESFSRVSLESIFYGVPLIATDVGGTREMMKEKSHSNLVPAKDVSAMVEAIKLQISDSELRFRTAQINQKYAQEQFGYQQTSEKLLGIYQELADQQ